MAVREKEDLVVIDKIFSLKCWAIPSGLHHKLIESAAWIPRSCSASLSQVFLAQPLISGITKERRTFLVSYLDHFKQNWSFFMNFCFNFYFVSSLQNNKICMWLSSAKGYSLNSHRSTTVLEMAKLESIRCKRKLMCNTIKL